MKIVKTTFSRGELSPELHGRTDVTAYGAGLAKARNTIVHTFGGISRRPGLKYVAPVGKHDTVPRLIPFEFNVTDQYILEFGDEYMRVIRNNSHVTHQEKTITGVNSAQRRITTSTNHGYSTGDEVYVSGTGTALDGGRYLVTIPGANTLTLKPQSNIGGTLQTYLFSGYVSGGTVSKIYEIETPYTIERVWELNYVPNADVMTFVHKSHNIYELSRNDHDDWEFNRAVFDNTTLAPLGISVTVNNPGTDTVVYKVTTVHPETGEESLPGLGTSVGISSITQADPAVVTTSSNHGWENYDEVYFSTSNNITELAGKRFTIANKTNDTFQLVNSDGTDVDGTDFEAFTTGSVFPTFVRITNSNTGAPDNTIDWTPRYANAIHNIYRYKGGSYGFIGESRGDTFDDENYLPESGSNPPEPRNPFKLGGDTPGAVGYFEQRRVFGGTTNKPDTTEFSQVGRQNNFSRNTPGQDDDAITATLVADQVNEIRHYVPLRTLLVLTSASEWLITSGQDTGFTPDTIRQARQSNWGCSKHKPIVINNTALFILRDEKNVRSLGYSYELDGYTGTNLNTFSRHLLDNNSIVDWCHQRAPDSRVYIVRDDGKALTVSFEQEQELLAWTTIDTQGDFEACAALRATSEVDDTIYFVVRRLIDGEYVRYIERLNQTTIDDIRDVFYVDSGLTYDVPIAINSIALNNPVRLNVTNHGLSVGDVVEISNCTWEPASDGKGDFIQYRQLNNYKFVVRGVESANVFSIEDENGDPVNGNNYSQNYVGNGYIRKGVSTISGLEHLEGRDVIALVDGSVLEDITVENGSITLESPGCRVHVGLSYVTDINTLQPTNPNRNLQGLLKRPNSVALRLYKSGAINVGPTLQQLTNIEQREFEPYGDPTALFTGEKDIVIDSNWDDATVWIRSYYPLPMTLLAIITDISTEEDDES